MIRCDLHIHSDYCDGKDRPEQIVRAAIARGLDCIGFSSHSYTFFDESYCMSKDKIPAYQAEIAALKEKYKDRIQILCGIEQDYYSTEPTDAYDYVIGSVHYLRCGDAYLPVDESKAILLDGIRQYFQNDVYALAECYFSTAADLVRKTGADIIGHFDLISKFNEEGALFDETHPRYVKAWQRALNQLLAADCAFEINTGAMARGYRTQPYPNADMRRYIKDRGGRLLLSSDSHSADTLCYAFDAWEAFL